MRATSLKIIPFAYQDIGYVCLKELIRLKSEIPYVITHKDDPGEKIWFRSVCRLAKSHNIPVLYTEDLSKDELKHLIEKERPDLIISLYFRKLLPEDIFSIPKYGSINLHGSFLPYYRGRCPVNWVILKGEKYTGLTFHFITKRPDAGDIIRRVKIPIGRADTAIDIYGKMTRKAPLLLRAVIADFLKGAVKRVKQNEAKATYFGGRKAEDGRIDWRSSAEEIYNLVRAVTHPYPGAFSYFFGKDKILIWKAVVVKDRNILKKKGFSPGKIVGSSKKYGMIVATRNGLVGCLKMQEEGRKECKGDILARRHGVDVIG